MEEFRLARRSSGLHRRPLDHDARGYIFPKSDEKLSSKRDNHCLADTAIAADPLMEPPAERRARLGPQPKPSELQSLFAAWGSLIWRHLVRGRPCRFATALVPIRHRQQSVGGC